MFSSYRNMRSRGATPCNGLLPCALSRRDGQILRHWRQGLDAEVFLENDVRRPQRSVDPALIVRECLVADKHVLGGTCKRLDYFAVIGEPRPLMVSVAELFLAAP